MQVITLSAEETQQVAEKIIEELISSDKKEEGALVLALEGDLGAGKTTFVQGIAKVLGVKDKILSPTFVIMKHFNLSAFKHFNSLYHIDCYRLSGIEDIKELGIYDALKDNKNIFVIEWPERIRAALPNDTVWIKFEHLGEDRRKLKM